MPGKELKAVRRIAREPEFDMDDEMREKAREFLGI